MLKMMKRLGVYWWLFALMILLTLINVTFDFLLPIFLGETIKAIQNTKEVGEVIKNASLMAVVGLLSAFANLFTGKCASKVTARLIAATRYDFFKKVEQFSLAETNKFSVSSLVTRSTNDLTFVSNTLNLVFRFILYGPLISISAVVVLLCYKKEAWMLTVAVFVALILMMVFMVILINVSLPKFKAIQGKLDKVSSLTRENLEGLRVVRAYNAEKYQEEKFSSYNNDLMKTDRFANRGLSLFEPVIHFIVSGLNVAIYLISAYLIPEKVIGYADMTVVIEYAALILTGFVIMTVLIIQLPRAIVCAKRVNEVLETEVSIQDGVGAETTEQGTIEFDDVSFCYPGAEKPVLSHISFKAKKGETIAFIGATGAGKTTLINLMPRFYDTTEGTVKIDGVNVKDYKLDDLYSRFGIVPQKGYLFHDSLVNNVALGRKDATAAQIKRALDISQSSEFVEKLPGNIDYEISQGGKNVSGGQRQRLCIARAIIMEPEIFIFDDSFSALDYRTDKILRGEIKKQCAGVTSVIVAQRVGTILNADQIIVLDGGEMVGKGTHKELLKNCPVYREIALSQLSKEELENE